MSISRHERTLDGPQLRAASVGFSSGYRWQVGGRDWGLLTWASRGVISVTVGDAFWVVPPDQALWLPSGTSHSVRMAGRGTLRQVYLASSVSASLATAPRVMSVHPLLRELLRRICTVGTLDRAIARERRLLDLLLDEMFDDMTEMHVQPVRLPMPTDARARVAAACIQRTPSDARHPTLVARESNASVRTLERLFRRETGLSFGLWRQRARLVHAMALLADGESVTRAGLAAGYATTSSFVAAFKRLAGVSPGRYARPLPLPPRSTSPRTTSLDGERMATNESERDGAVAPVAQCRASDQITSQHYRNLPRRRIALHQRVCFRNPLKRKRRRNARRHRSTLQPRHHLAGERVRDVDPLLQRSTAQHRTAHRQPSREHEAQIQRALQTGQRADDHQPSFRGHGGDALAHVVAAQEVEHHIHAASVGPSLHRGAYPARLSRRRAVLHADGACRLQLQRSTCCPEDACAELSRDLDRRQADATADGVNEHRLARTDRRLRHQRVVRGDARFGRRAGDVPADGVRHRRHRPLVRHKKLGVGATAHEPTDACADRPLCRVRPTGCHLARELKPGYVRRHAGRGGVTTGPLQQIRSIEGRAANPDEDLADARYWHCA